MKQAEIMNDQIITSTYIFHLEIFFHDRSRDPVLVYYSVDGGSPHHAIFVASQRLDGQLFFLNNGRLSIKTK